MTIDYLRQDIGIAGALHDLDCDHVFAKPDNAKFLPTVVEITRKHQSPISKVTMFGVVFYLFLLSTSQLLFRVSGIALILTVFSVDQHGATLISPIMIAYFIQIGLAGFLNKVRS